MRRRTVLAAASALLAGCLGASDGEPTTTRSKQTTDADTPTATETTTGAPTTTERFHEPVVFEPASMTDDEVVGRLADRDCSELADVATICPDDDARLGVSVSPTIAELPSDAVEFTIENRADEAFKWNAYNWVLRKWDGNEWRRIAPLAIPGSLDRLPAGESHTYRIKRVKYKSANGSRVYVTEEHVTLEGLGPGVYGFSTDGYFESSPDDEFAVAAVFGFAGEAPPIGPTDGVDRVERDGAELRVHAVLPEHGRSELVVSLVDGDPDVRLLAEHVHQLRPLLNSLPYLAIDGVEAVRYVGHADEVNLLDSYLPAVSPDGATGYGFRDLVFEVASRE